MAQARASSEASSSPTRSEGDATDKTSDASTPTNSPTQEQGPLQAAGPSVGLAAQTKPVLGSPGDRYEQEANAFAESVTKGKGGAALSRVTAGDLGGAQRQTEEDEEQVQAQSESTEEDEEPVQTQTDEEEEMTQTKSEEEEEPVQKQVSSEKDDEEAAVQAASEDEEESVQADPADEGTGNGASPGGRVGTEGGRSRRDVAARAIRGKGPGRPMHPGTRRTIERRGGVDLRGVRVHDGPQARSAAGELGARAFTHNRDIWLGPGASDRNLGLMAHEVAHVVQQGAARRHPGQEQIQARSGSTEEDEEAVQQQMDEEKEVTQAKSQDDEEPIQQQSEETEAVVQGGWLSTAGSWVASTAEAAVDTVKNVTMSVVTSVLPAPAVDFIKDVANHPEGVIGAIYEKLKGVVSGIFDFLGDQSPALEGIFETFKGFLSRAQQIVQALIAGDCDPLFQAISDLQAVVGDLAGDAWTALTDFLEPVTTFLEDVWEKIGSPITEWIQGAAGEAWGTIKSIWENIKAVGSKLASVAKTVGSAVWTWITNKLGFGGGESDEDKNGAGGIGAWILDMATAAWSKVTDAFAPVIKPIKSVVSKAKELIPLGAIKTMQEKLASFKQNMGQMGEAAGSPDDVANNQGRLRESILPTLLGAVDSVIAAVGSAKSWLVSTVKGLSGPVNAFFASLEQVDFLSGLASALSWVKSGVSTIQTWAASVVGTLFDLVQDALRSLKGFIRPVYRTLIKIVGVLGDFVGGIKALVTSVWTEIPACIRETLKDFLVDKILANVPFFQKLKAVKQAWDTIVATAQRALYQVFVDGDLLGAAWTVFKALLRAIGLPPKLVTTLINNALKAFTSFFQDPVGFLMNMVKALQKGFLQFIDNFPTHFFNGLTDWLFSALEQAGVDPPASLELSEIFRFVLEVLGVTFDKVVRKLAEEVGVPKEKIDAMIERLKAGVQVAKKGLMWIQKLATEGPSAIWEWIKGKLSNLKEMVFGAITDWIQTKVIEQVAKRMALFLDPTGIGAVINIVKTIWDAVQSFIDYAKELIQIVNSIFEGVTSIAKGVLGKAAGFLETALADAIPVAIGFLARQVGLANLPRRIEAMLETVRAKVEEGIDWLVGKTVSVAEKALYKVRKATGSLTGEEEQNEKSKQKAETEIRARMRGGIPKDELQDLVAAKKREYNLTRAELTSDHDVVLMNSDAIRIGGTEESISSRRTIVASEEEKIARRGRAEDYREKEGEQKLLDFESESTEKETIRGALEGNLEGKTGIEVSEVPFLQDVPKKKRRPDKAKAKVLREWTNVSLSDARGDTGVVGRLGTAESVILSGKERDYEGGHLIANMFGGPESEENLVPQLGNVINRSLYGDIERYAETFIESVEDPNSPKQAILTVNPSYPGGQTVKYKNISGGLRNIEGKRSKQRATYREGKKRKYKRVGLEDYEGGAPKDVSGRTKRMTKSKMVYIGKRARSQLGGSFRSRPAASGGRRLGRALQEEMGLKSSTIDKMESIGGGEGAHITMSSKEIVDITFMGYIKTRKSYKIKVVVNRASEFYSKTRSAIAQTIDGDTVIAEGVPSHIPKAFDVRLRLQGSSFSEISSSSGDEPGRKKRTTDNQNVAVRRSQPTKYGSGVTTIRLEDAEGASESEASSETTGGIGSSKRSKPVKYKEYGWEVTGNRPF